MNYEGYRDFEEYYSTSMHHAQEHFHRSIEFLYSESSVRRVLLDGTPYTIMPGQMLIVPPFTLHEYDECDGVCYCNVLPIEYSKLWETRTAGKRLASPIVCDEQLASDLFFHLRQINGHTNDLLKEGIYRYTIGTLLSRASFESDQVKQAPDFTTAVLTYIDDHFNRPLTLDELAKQFGYSKYYFSYLFNKHFKMNFKSYLNKVRVVKATALLDRYTISEVSDMCGYNSLQSFFLNFKRVTKLTPKQYISGLQSRSKTDK